MVCKVLNKMKRKQARAKQAKKYFRTLKDWTQAEDRLLTKLVKAVGNRQWTLIAEKMSSTPRCR